MDGKVASPRFGQGLNSIRVRFTLLIGGCGALSLLALYVTDRLINVTDLATLVALPILLLLAAMPMVLTYVLTGTLTRPIETLRRRALAIANGDFQAPVEVDSQSEVGALADSFRAMVTKLNSNLSRVNVLAYTDRVTGLPNRAVLTHVLDYGLAKDRDPRLTGGLLFIDLDNFKQVNDTMGHEAGDEILRAASSRILKDGFGKTVEDVDTCTTALGELAQRLPEGLVFVRFAGDEFVALLPGVTSSANLAHHAGRIVSAIQKPFHVNGQDVSIGASVGIAVLHVDSADPLEIVKFADTAMYAAKQAGRGQIAFYSREMSKLARDRTKLEAELREAIHSGQLRVHFQPKINIRHVRLAGVEALVRWQHPTRGLLAPGHFIAVAEQTGLIEDLGNEVLRLSIQQCRRWFEQNINIRISINVCHLQFRRLDFADNVLRMIQAASIPPSMIELELTETVAMENPEFSKRHLIKLRAAGVRISVDDFGTGYSNLSQLVQLPFDTLKIDKSMLDNIRHDKKAGHVVTAIINMAKALGYETVAEGVEQKEQFAFLYKRGCDIVQGYLFARPMDVDALMAWRKLYLKKPAEAPPMPEKPIAVVFSKVA